MKKPLQALLISGEKMRDEVLCGTKTINIRTDFRGYDVGEKIFIGCDILNWVTIKIVTSVRYTTLENVTEDEYKQDGFTSFDDLYMGLKEFYPDIVPSSKVTVIKWC